MFDAAETDCYQLKRLVSEAAGYLGTEFGDTIPVREVRLQAQANGYSETDFQRILEEADVAGKTEITVPERDGSIFGSLWSANAPTTFENWLNEKRDNNKTKENGRTHQYPVRHSFSWFKERERYARAKNLERFYVQETDTFSTILLTHVADSLPGETSEEQAQKFHNSKVTRKLRDILKNQEVWGEASILYLLAPKKPENDTPKTHMHIFVWIPGEISPDVFHPVIEKHCEVVEGASMDNHPLDKAVTVQTHVSEEVESPDKVDDEKGATTTFSQEVGNNLPLLDCDFDALGADDYIRDWCAIMSAGSDGKHDSRGVTRFKQAGSFKEIADYMYAVEKEEEKEEEEREEIDLPAPWSANAATTKEDSPDNSISESPPSPESSINESQSSEKDSVSESADESAKAETTRGDSDKESVDEITDESANPDTTKSKSTIKATGFDKLNPFG